MLVLAFFQTASKKIGMQTIPGSYDKLRHLEDFFVACLENKIISRLANLPHFLTIS